MYPSEDKIIPIDKCVERKVYKVIARNILIGVYHKTKSIYSKDDWFNFLGIRTKFGKRFIDSENHYFDTKYASCAPVEEICDLPEEIHIDDDKTLFEWLDKKEKEIGSEWKSEMIKQFLEEKKILNDPRKAC